jgi:hypothetical protein
MDKYNVAIKYIMQEQESIIGPIAVDLVNQVEGVEVSNNEVKITTNDPKKTLSNVVNQFQSLFGQLSIEVSKQVIKSKGLQFAPGELPEILV